MSLEVGESYDRLYNWYNYRRAKERKTLKTEQIESHSLSRSARRRIPAVVKRALEARYNNNYYPTRDELEQMSQELGESYNRIYNWFYTRREKERQMLKALGIESHPLLEKRCLPFSTAVTAALEAKYNDNYYPTRDELEQMSQELGESYNRLHKWFFTRRMKERQMLKAAGIESHPVLESPRRPMSTAAKAALAANYVKNRNPTYEEVEKMSQELGESHDRVSVWYIQRRFRERQLMKSTGMQEQPGQFRVAPNRSNLRPYWRRLEVEFRQDLYPTVEKRKLLAEELAVSWISINAWFTYRRQKERALRRKAGLETGEFARTGLKLRAKAKFLQKYLNRTQNSSPSQRQLRALARKIEEPVPVVHRWFAIRRALEKARPNKKDP
ncbi:hypothetical protein BDZ89DRAFT_1070533 [Hymenopellis radicata]|nr:hypothetical protein BDZ89DRAFT_1070533 [Hymenopellis radicata]